MTEKRLREIIREEIESMKEEAVREYREGVTDKFKRNVERYGEAGVSRITLQKVHNYTRADIDRELLSGGYIEKRVFTGEVTEKGKERVERRVFLEVC